MDESKDSIFSLYVSGINLSDINPVDSAKLLEALCGLIGTSNLKWGDIKEGSAAYDVRVEHQYVDKKFEHFNESVLKQNTHYKAVVSFLDKYPKAKTNLKFKKSANDEHYKDVYEFKKKENFFIFTQDDVIRGRVTGLREGVDSTDHIRVKLLDGHYVNVAILPQLSISLGQKWRTNHQLEFWGKAKYRYFSPEKIELLEFYAEKIVEVHEKNLTNWIDDFRSAGESDWNQFENPIEQWLKERKE